MSTAVSYPFTTPSNYTYDTSKVEVVNGKAKLRSQNPTGSVAYNTFTTSKDLIYTEGSGDRQGTLNGGAVVTGGYVVCTSGPTDCVYWNGDNFPFLGVGAVKVKVKPAFTGAPSSNGYIWDFRYGSGEMYLSITASGALRFTMKNDNGSGAVDFNTSTVSWVAGQDHEVEVNIDNIGKQYRVYVDGALKGSNTLASVTRTQAITEGVLGAYSGKIGGLNASYSDLVVFDTVQHTGASYTPGYTLSEVAYPTDNPVIVPTATFKSTEIRSFTSDITALGLDKVKFVLNINGTDTYWTGSEWATSAGYSQSNTTTEMDVNAEAALSSRCTVVPKIYLHSENGLSTPYIDNITITYDLTLADPSLPFKVNLEGFIYASGTPAAGQTVKFRPYQEGWINEGVMQRYAFDTVATTDSAGHFSADVFLQPSGKFWEMKIGPQTYKVALSQQEELNLKDLPVFEVITNE